MGRPKADLVLNEAERTQLTQWARRAKTAQFLALRAKIVLRCAEGGTTWMPMLALTGKARLWEPRRLRLRLFTAAGQLVTTGRRQILRLARHWPWTHVITDALERLALLPNPG
nr:transposase [Streptomyces sp. CEV 2-1]